MSDSIRVTANSSPQLLFTTPLHMKAKIEDVDIDNQGTSGPITVQLQDEFVTSAGVVNPTATSTKLYRFQATVQQAASFSADSRSFVKTQCLGRVSAVADKIDAGAVIIVRYTVE